MDVIVDVQTEVDSSQFTLPSTDNYQQWVNSVLDGRMEKAELTIRIVDETEMSSLNKEFRNKMGTTNVLSFPSEIDVPLEYPLLGDIVICAAVVVQEAEQQNKTLLSHWAHMTVHGTLHLLGYDHITDEQANEMETEEKILMERFGFANPYEVNSLQ